MNSSAVETTLDYLAYGHGLGIYNVRDPRYGARGEGTTDDTAAIQSAIDACSSAGGGIVFIPAGTYNHTGLTKPLGVSLIGVGQPSLLVLKAGVTGSGITVPAPAAGVEPHDVLANLWLEGVTGSADGIHFSDGTTATDCLSRVSNCRIYSFAGHGIYVGSYLGGVQVGDQTQVDGCGGDGIHVLGTDADIDRAVIDSNTGDGVYVGGTICTIRGCSIGGNTNGVVCYSSGASIVGNGIDRNNQRGIYVGGVGALIVGNTLHSNSLGVDAGWSDIEVVAGPVTVSSNYFYFDGGYTERPAWNIQVDSGQYATVHGNYAGAGYAHSGLSNYSTPTVPATGVASTVFPFDTDLYVTASTSTVAVSLTPPGGSATSLGTLPASAFGSFHVPAGSTVTLTYTVAPTWQGTLSN